MAPEEQDAAYLWDIREAAKEAVSILGDKSVETFKKDKILCRAIERIIEIVGEAARKGFSGLPDATPGNSLA